MENATIVHANGISSTQVKANNLRGINVRVEVGAKQATITFETLEHNGQYSITVQPNWRTMDWITKKDKTGFAVEFSEAVPPGGKIDWQLIR